MDIVIIDSHVLFRQGLAHILTDYPDLKVVSQAGTLREGINAVRALKPEIVLMALNLSDQPGTEALRILVKEKGPATNIIVMSSSESDRAAIHAIRAGARGYVQKFSSIQTLIASIRAVERNEIALSRRLTTQLVEEYTRLSAAVRPVDSCYYKLTYREKEILACLGEGLKNGDIGRELNISQNTVKVHVHNVLEKLQMTSRREAGKFARSNGLLARSKFSHKE